VSAPPLHRNREFVALWVGNAVSWLGISISSFAYPLVVLQATGSAAQAGLVGSVLTATTFFLRLPAGALTDRWDRKRIMIACDAGRAAGSASLALALAFGRFHLWHVLLVAFLEGSLGTLFGPAESAAVRRVVAPEQRREAVALNQSRVQLPSLVGPPLGGVLLSLSRALPFVADAVSYLVSLIAVLFVRTP
jgi:MFS family permease